MKPWGYFDSPEQTTPVYDPGLHVDCPFCGIELHGQLKTISLMLDGDTRSYFYRAHKPCYDGATAHAVSMVESSLIDAIARARDVN